MEDKTTKVRIAFFIILVGIATMFTAVVTDHWAVLSPRVERLNTTCQAAHFGLWRLCLKSIYIQEPDPKGKGCGPISLPGAWIPTPLQREQDIPDLGYQAAALWIAEECRF
ncbi:UNVERIFIED_CONTAM: hypothetical protein FKN15_070418 [Acipenser sinensis]